MWDLTISAILVLATVLGCKCLEPDNCEFDRLKRDVELLILSRLQVLEFSLNRVYITVRKNIESKRSKVKKNLLKSSKTAGKNTDGCPTKYSDISDRVEESFEKLELHYESIDSKSKKILDEIVYKLDGYESNETIYIPEFEKNITEIGFKANEDLNSLIFTTYTYPYDLMIKLFEEVEDLRNEVEECIRNK